jgi:diguanylate cyclase (GGDEF)-like protein/PAS domain S-box-containing protein
MTISLFTHTFLLLSRRLFSLLAMLFLTLCVNGIAQALTIDNLANSAAQKINSDTHLKNDTLIVGSESDYPPFATGMTDATAGGFTVDLWKAVAAEAGLKYKIRVLPFHELLQEFKAGKIDVLINLATSSERHAFADFTVPHSIIHGGIFVRKGESRIRSEADLAGKSIILINADLAHDYAVSKGWEKQLVLVDTAAEGMKLLASGKHDAMLVSKLAGLQTVQALRLTNIEALKPNAGFSQKFAFAVREGHSELFSAINEGLALTKSNGTYNKIYEKWFGIYDIKEVGWRDLLKYFLPVVFLFLGFAQYAIYRRNTERKATQKALQESEHKLSIILEGVDACIYLKDMEGRYLFANRALRKLFGVTKEGIVGQGDDKFYEADTVAKLRANDRLVLDEGQILRIKESNLKLHDGRISTYLVVKAPLYNEFGQIYALCGISTDITERQQSESKLQASDERYRAILDTAMDGFWQVDIQGRLLDINATYCQMSGYSEQELLTMHIPDVEALESANDTAAHIQMIISQGEARFESQHRRKDGSVFDVEVSVQYKAVDGGRLIVFLRDITERKQSGQRLQQAQAELQANQLELEMQNDELRQAQTALVDSRGRYIDLYEFAPVGYLSISKHGLIAEVNWKATAMFGFPRKLLLQRRFAQFVADDDKGRWQRQFSSMVRLSGGEELSFDLKFVHENESTFYAKLNCLRMDDEDDQPMLRMTLVDITQVKQLEEARLKDEVSLQAMLNAIPDLMFEAGLNGRIYSFHIPRINLLTVPPEGVVGKVIPEFLPADASAVCMAALQEANEHDYSGGRQFELTLEQGRTWFELSVARKKMLPDEEPHFVVLARDITERKKAAQRIEQLLAEKNAVLENRLVGIATMRDRKILWANLAFEIMFGYSQDELIGMSTRPLYVNDEDYQVVGAAYARIESEGIVRLQGEYLRKNGQHLYLNISGAMLNKETGESLWVFVDVTELKHAESALAETHYILQTIIDTAPIRIFWKDKDLRFLGCNPAFAKDAGMASPNDLIGKDDYEMGWAAQADLYRADDRTILDTGIAKLFYDEPQTTPTGQIIWLRTAKVPLKNKDNQTVGLLGIYEEITDQKLAENDLRIAATAFESQEGILVTDANNVILRVNRAFTKVTGYSAEDAIGKTPGLLTSGYHDADFYEGMWRSINETGLWEGEIWNRRKNGEVYPEHLIITAVKDNAGVVTNYVATLNDITVHKAAAKEIHHLAFYDALTRLPNRRLLLDRLNHALAASTRSGKEGAVLFLDLDHFKTLNDTLGHDIGDLLLQQVAERLTACVREGDTVARLGGDEYVIMLEDLSEHDIEAAAQAEVIGEKILIALNKPYHLGAHEHHCTSSIGITLFNDHKSGIEELLKQADIAMYQAKKSGRNTLRFFDPGMQDALHARVDIERELRKALEKKQFHLYYQIQVESSGRPIGAEVLIRWLHPERGLVSPYQFIPLAEDTGLILPIGQWVLESACAQLKAWEQNTLTRDLTLSLNVSPKQFRQADFMSQVNAAVEHYAINPTLLKFELTESILLENIEDTIATMSALKDIGIRFSLDDFGTGYSSLQYLKRLPLYQLKIDQSFVRDIKINSSDQAIVCTIIAMAHTLNLNVIAEGVETEEQYRLLLNHDCTHYQGNFFGRPVPIAEFEASLEHNV